MPPIEYPADWNVHGDKGLICTPSKWSSVLIFCFTNYFAHCITVRTYPGETVDEYSVGIALALVLPSSGITRALDSIIRRSNLRKMDELGRAGKAGALCMVIREIDWRPRRGDVLPYIAKSSGIYSPASDGTQGVGLNDLTPRDVDVRIQQPVDREVVSEEEILSSNENIDLETVEKYRIGFEGEMREIIRTSQPRRSILKRSCKVHGQFKLPSGYTLAYVPSSAAVVPYLGKQCGRRGLRHRKPTSVQIASTYNLVKAVVAIAQTVYASMTLYKTRGNQIETYGYASFGLTVLPYVLMSILNLFSQIACAEYSTLFMVQSDIMDEARKRGGIFDGVAGTLKLPPGDIPTVDGVVRGPWTVKIPPNTKQCGRAACVLRKEADAGHKAWEITVVDNANTEYATNPETIYFPSSSPLFGSVKLVVDNNKLRVKGLLAQRQSQYSSFLGLFAPLIFGCISLLVVGLMTRFRKGNKSTEVQRGFAISWLVIGMLFGSLERPISRLLLGIRGRLSAIIRGIGLVLIYGVFLVPAVGGFVVVCKMIVSYGTCTSID